MRQFSRAILLLLAAALVVASLPPGFDEDRSIEGFCSPDCLLQQDATHSVAIAPPPARQDVSVEPTPERSRVAPAVAPRVHAAAPDCPRAPPQA